MCVCLYVIKNKRNRNKFLFSRTLRQMMIHMVLSLKIIPKSDVFRLRFSISNGKRYIGKVYVQYTYRLLACLCSNGMHLYVWLKEQNIDPVFSVPFLVIHMPSRRQPSARASKQFEFQHILKDIVTIGVVSPHRIMLSYNICHYSIVFFI